MTDTARLAVVICTYNRCASLMHALDSLYADGYAGSEPVDILVVANHCSDDTLAALERFERTHPSAWLRLAWIEEPTPGKSHALNAAIRETGHDALCFIDDDQQVESGFLRNLLDGLAAYPDADIFCGKIWPAWDGSEPSWVHAQPPYAIPIRPFPEFDPGPATRVLSPADRFPSGGNISVRRRVFDLVGGFSCELGPTGHNLAGGEDHEFIARAVARGCRIRYLPGVRQLHAIDAERMNTGYTLRKSYLRSRANFLVKAPESRPRLYMFRKIAGHFARAACTFNAARRLFYLVRLAASVGELSGAFSVLRHGDGLPALTQSRDPAIRALAVLGAITVAGATVAVLTRPAAWTTLLPALLLAGVGTLVILVKSLLDFSQTGPHMREDVLRQYRRYTLFAVARLSAWAYLILVFTGSAGMLLGYLAATARGVGWSASHAIDSALLGMVGGFVVQFVRKLRFNPGLLVASMHYRSSRLYRLWAWATPRRIRGAEALLVVGTLALFGVASWRLMGDGRAADIVPLAAALIFFCGVIVTAAWQPEASPRRARSRSNRAPNILMVGSDTLRADRLGGMGYRRALTPNIDALAATGAHFTNCYVPCARTAPSLISMLTGTWPHRHGIRDNFATQNEARLCVDALPTLLKPLGYFSAVISDWCGGDMGKFSFGFGHADLPDDQWNLKYLIRQGPKDLRLFVSLFTHNRLGRWLLPELYYLGGVPLTQPMGRRARHLLSRLAGSEAPFFLNVFYSTTHPPFASEWPWYTRYADPAYAGESKFAMARLTDPFEIIRRQSAPREEFDLDQIIDLYDGTVAQFDDEVGKMLDHVEACGLAENTVIVVYSDHGMEFFEHDTWGQGNSAVGEASPRIPLVIRDPRQAARGRVDSIVRSIDIAPTLIDLAGGTPAAHIDGVSLAACLKPETPCPKLDAFNETGIWIADIPGLPKTHLRYPNLLDLIEVPDREHGALGIKHAYYAQILAAKDRMIRRGRWKLVYQPLEDGASVQLFDVEDDPECRRDVSAAEPEVQGEMLVALKAWMNPSA